MQARSVLLLTCDNSIETVSMYYCALRIGVVPILLDSRVSVGFLTEYIISYRPQYIWIKRNTYQEKELHCCKEYIGYKDHILYKSDYEQYEINSELGIVLTTSGTTGSKKTVRISYDNILHNTRMVNEIFSISPCDRAITSLPIHHSLGLLLLHAVWMAGGSALLYEGMVLNPDYLRLIDKYKVTVTFLVPYNLDLIYMTDITAAAYDCLRCVMIGGEKLQDKTREQWLSFCDNHKIQSFLGYGQTEGSGYISCVDFHKQIDRDHVGIPHTDTEIWLDHKDNQNIGELVIKNKSVSLGYAHNWSDLKKGDENKGILRTGDIAYIDEIGNLYIKGRKKRIVKILGERISLDDLEEIIKSGFPNCGVACLEIDGNLTVIYDNDLINKNDISARIEQATNIHKKMIRIVLLDKLPRLSNGKTDYLGIRSQVCNE